VVLRLNFQFANYFLTLFLQHKIKLCDSQNTEILCAKRCKANLHKYRSEFHFPKVNEQTINYFTGNSLGLQPKRTKSYIEVMNDWANLSKGIFMLINLGGIITSALPHFE
jgi:hypothetical protein